ncbi:M20/M25/M40 family metallo-hydrolase [Microbulbifer thermotolerans]|uniref:Carboxypeptidase Q n=1 Tax=Microbulbifer thermotolerans TaxID=252514 RepID=A0AB35HWH9_MICTH|nr:M20/M25/M40 family metallo-hydrolase [Microbulbifer thermotolerans]MCX2801244.1 M20/M25/M40 family metallo-hydrolase [Microbulbifer thermotolerans]MCX2832445.1 M20/M25/M40 family metallo-hydrolase [Microbulbifer thermotolerans]MCX2835992.1 M20/M25/M40 family metallo-hydrolase [Microbulbifer thermotolerans]
MLRPLLTLTGGLLAALAVVSAQAKPLSQEDISVAEVLRDRALESSDAYSLVESLTVEVGPRRAGTEGDRRAVAWALQKMKTLGFDRVYTEQIDVKRWHRGHAHAEVVAPFPQPLVVSSLGYSVPTPEGGLTAEIVEFADVEALIKAPAKKVKGKIVFINRRMERARTGEGYGPAVQGRSKGMRIAAEKGAVALLLRSVGTDSDRFAHTGMMSIEGVENPVPALALSAPDANLLEAMLKRGKPVEVKLDVDNELLADGPSFNVIGEITGREKPEEVMIIGAHLDSWDEGTGALDDGAGVAIVLETARLIAELPSRPRRTLRVVLFGAEEIGLVGAKQYVEAHRSELDNIIAVSESDFGAGKVWRFDTRLPENKFDIADQMMQLLAPLGIERGNNNSHGGPDGSVFVAQGVPAFGLYQDGTDYFDFHHTPNDTLDKVDPENLKQNVAAWVVMSFLVAEMEGDLGRVPTEH